MKKILIIYERVSVGELLAEELATDGYLVVPIGRPTLAKDVIYILRPDLVLLDLQINEKDRSYVLEEIKKQDPNLRVLAFTTYDGYKEDLRRSLADAYVIKSFRFNELRGKAADVLQRKPVNAGELKRTENLQI